MKQKTANINLSSRLQNFIETPKHFSIDTHHFYIDTHRNLIKDSKIGSVSYFIGGLVNCFESAYHGIETPIEQFYIDTHRNLIKDSKIGSVSYFIGGLVNCFESAYHGITLIDSR